MTPTIVDVDAFALHNAFEVNYPEAMKGFVGLINIGNEVTNVNIMDDGVPILTRDLTWARAASVKICSASTAHRDKTPRLIRGYDRSPHLDACSQRAARRSPSASSAPPRSSRRRGIRGAAARRLHLRRRLAHAGPRRASRRPAQFQSQHANPLARLNIRDGALDSLTTDEVAPLLMLPIGLALRQ